MPDPQQKIFLNNLEFITKFIELMQRLLEQQSKRITLVATTWSIDATFKVVSAV